jgi:hypothetical protein
VLDGLFMSPGGILLPEDRQSGQDENPGGRGSKRSLHGMSSGGLSSQRRSSIVVSQPVRFVREDFREFRIRN